MLLLVFDVALLFAKWGSHLDHVGALAYFTEVLGYNGPVYMTVSPYPATCLMKCLPEHMKWFVEFHKKASLGTKIII